MMAAVRGLALCVALLLVSTAVSAQVPASTLQIEPPQILADLLYNGYDIRISGNAPAGEGLVVLCMGQEGTVELKQKGKVWGLLWLNVGDIVFHHIPAFYKLASSKELHNLAPEAELIRAGVGYPALEARTIPNYNERSHGLFMELMKLKEHEDFYSIQEKQLKVTPLAGPMESFSTVFHLPASAGSGEYSIQLIGFAGGKAVKLASGKLSVRLSGSAAVIKSASLNNGLLYGVFAVVVALAAGLSTGLIFGHRSSKGGH